MLQQVEMAYQYNDNVMDHSNIKLNIAQDKVCLTSYEELVTMDSKIYIHKDNHTLLVVLSI